MKSLKMALLAALILAGALNAQADSKCKPSCKATPEQCAPTRDCVCTPAPDGGCICTPKAQASSKTEAKPEKQELAQVNAKTQAQCPSRPGCICK